MGRKKEVDGCTNQMARYMCIRENTTGQRWSRETTLSHSTERAGLHGTTTYEPQRWPLLRPIWKNNSMMVGCIKEHDGVDLFRSPCHEQLVDRCINFVISFIEELGIIFVQGELWSKPGCSACMFAFASLFMMYVPLKIDCTWNIVHVTNWTNWPG